MAATKLTDIIVPEVFTPNNIERTSERSRFIQSGIITEDNSIPIGRGTEIQLPFYQDLSGADNVWDDTTDISLNKIGMAQDTAVVLTREKAFASSDLAASLGDDDPMNAINDLVANYWARRNQKTLIKILEGAMGASNMTENVLDISTLSGGASNFDGAAFVDAAAKLGDHQDQLAAIAVHSAVYADMKKNDLIDFVEDSTQNQRIATYMGHEVIVDDGLPVTSGVYTSYLFARGAVTMVNEPPENADEPYRHPDKNGGTDALYTRRKMVMHPRGIRWQPQSGVPSSATPSNSELADSNNWTRVFEPENIRIVQFKHTVA